MNANATSAQYFPTPISNKNVCTIFYEGHAYCVPFMFFRTTLKFSDQYLNTGALSTYRIGIGIA